MITVNLLPSDRRKAPTSSWRQYVQLPIVKLVIGLLIGWGLLLGGLLQWQQVRLAHVSARLQELAPRKSELDALTTSVEQLRTKHSELQALYQQRSRLGQALNRLSDLLPEGIWLTDFACDLQDPLMLQGAAIVDGGQETARIRKLSHALQADPVFATLVKHLQLGSITKTNDKDIELAQFTLVDERDSTGKKK